MEEEIAKKYGIDIELLEKEQKKLAETLKIKDAMDFSFVERIGAIENIIIQNKIISAMIVCDKNYEIIEQEYFFDKLRFPYIFGFKDYRELPNMISVLTKIKEKPDVILIKGEGINHPRLGLASHFALSAGIPVIGISDSLFEENKIRKGEVFIDKKIVGKLLASKEGSKPLCISPGNSISIESAYNLVKNLIVFSHKLPEPMHLAHKYAKEVRRELNI